MNIYWWATVFFLFIVGASRSLTAQYSISEISSAHGIEHEHIKELCQDNRGLLWYIGTSRSKGRDEMSTAIGYFDGYSCREYVIEELNGHDPSVTHMEVWGNYIIIHTHFPYRLVLFNLHTHTFSFLSQGEHILPVVGMKIDKDLLHLLVHHDSISTQYFTFRDSLAYQFSIPRALNIHVADNHIWMSHMTTIGKYTLGGSFVRKYTHADFNLSIPTQAIGFFKTYSIDGSTVFALANTQPAMHVYDMVWDKFRPYGKIAEDRYAISIKEDSNQNRFFTYHYPFDDPLYLLVNSEGDSINMTAAFSHYGKFAYVQSEDYNNYIYVGHGQGITKYNRELNFVKHVTTGRSMRSVIPLSDSINILTSENDGWEYYNKYTEETTIHSRIFDDIIVGTRGYLRSADSNIWTNNCSAIINLSTGAQYPIDHYCPESFMPYKNKEIFLAYGNGTISHFSTTTLEHQDWQYTGANPGRIYSMAQLDADNILIGGMKGLFMLELKNKRMFKVDAMDIPIYTIEIPNLEQGASAVYLGNSRGDLRIGHINNRVFEQEDSFHFTSAIASINWDKNENMWLGLYDGIARIDTAGKIELLPDDILIHPECNRFSNYWDEEHNELYIGSINGMNCIDVDAYDVQFEDFSIFPIMYEYAEGDSLSMRSSNAITHSDEPITIPAENRYFCIAVYTDSYRAPDGVSYEYRVDSGPWINNGSSNRIIFSYLPSGKKIIDVRAKNRNSNYSQNYLTVQLDVKNFFYYNPIFIIGVSLSIALLIYTWIRRIKSENQRLETQVAIRTRKIEHDRDTIAQQAIELGRLDEMKNTFYTNISHELKTPLTLITSPVERLLQSNNLSEDDKYYLDLVHTNSEILTERVHELLELERLEHNKVQLELEEIDLNCSLQKWADVFIPMAQSKKIDLKVQVRGEEYKGIIDKKKLRKVIGNLLQNAIKFTPENNAVSFSTLIADDILSICVEDEGRGIAEEDLPFIFDRFYQVPLESSLKNPGTGIGLSLIHEYVHIMGGDIQVESQLNLGTKFNVAIPFTIVKDQNNTALSEKILVDEIIPQRESRTQPLILLVEDNVDMRSFLRKLLEGPYSVVEAENGRAALEIYKKHPNIDIIISDIMMPLMDGVELLKQIRKRKETYIKPFIFLTAKSNVQSQIEAYRLGIDDYILKPFSEEALIARIEAVYKNYKVRLSTSQSLPPSENAENDEVFVQKLTNLVRDHLSDPTFSTDLIAQKLGISRRQLIRILKKEIGMLPKDFIREVRLITARSLIEQNNYSMGDVLSQIGLKDLSHFKKLYLQRFGGRL